MREKPKQNSVFRNLKLKREPREKAGSESHVFALRQRY